MSPLVSKESLLSRIDALRTQARGPLDAAKSSELYHATLTVIRTAHGPASPHEGRLLHAMAAVDREKQGALGWRMHNFLNDPVRGALDALRDDVELGLVGNVALQAAGLELGNFLLLAKGALEHPDGKNVAAVLVAAAFEDTLRRLAETKAGVADRPKLEAIIGRLKEAGLLAGPSVPAASGYLKFRNDALHAHWEQVDLPTIAGCSAFVESLLQQHFS